MSTIEEAMEIVSNGASQRPPIGRLRRIGDWLERAGEWLNPLLVKECRQALKSRQFALTFSLVLLLCWLWSIAGIARLGPTVEYRFDGPEMFFGYYLILAFPLLVVVPYSAYRSLIAEREDNTFELVAITTLKPRQIAGGKLGSAVLQILVYFSAAAPCLAFTYMLRGIDMLTIGWILFYTFLGSIGFSLAALLLATAAKEKHWQIVVSVALVIGLFYSFTGACAACYESLRYPWMQFHESGWWIANLAFLTAYGSTFALLYLAAGAQLTFTADNRSTPLRIAMLAQHVLFAGWMSFVPFYAAKHGGADDLPAISIMVAVTYMTFTTIYWYVMGAFMEGESTDLSARVKRGLPKSFMGRVFFTWFNPGPGTGYMFAVGNALAAAIFASAVSWYWQTGVLAGRPGMPSFNNAFDLIWFLLGYLVIYLGIANLILRLLRRVAVVTLATSVLMQLLLLLAGWGIPKVIALSNDQYINSGYSLLYITDPFMSCWEVFEPLRGFSANAFPMRLVLIPVAGLVFFLNLLYVVPDVQQVRIAKPKRVEEEDEALEASAHPQVAQPRNPWDE
jgi:hypothetical protein